MSSWRTHTGPDNAAPEKKPPPDLVWECAGPDERRAFEGQETHEECFGGDNAQVVKKQRTKENQEKGGIPPMVSWSAEAQLTRTSFWSESQKKAYEEYVKRVLYQMEHVAEVEKQAKIDKAKEFIATGKLQYLCDESEQIQEADKETLDFVQRIGGGPFYHLIQNDATRAEDANMHNAAVNDLRAEEQSRANKHKVEGQPTSPRPFVAAGPPAPEPTNKGPTLKGSVVGSLIS